MYRTNEKQHQRRLQYCKRQKGENFEKNNKIFDNYNHIIVHLLFVI